ncbi:MAG: hypothetical protein QXS01_06080 [Candidatus Bathyarchaeia archaeon]
MKRKAQFLVTLGLASVLVRGVALETGRPTPVPGDVGGTILADAVFRYAPPIVLMVGDDSRSMASAVVPWGDVLPTRPLRQARASDDPAGRDVDFLLVSAAGVEYLPGPEREALARTGRYERPDDGNDSWLPQTAASTCTDEGAGLDGVSCGPHAAGLTGDEVLRSAAAILWTAAESGPGLAGLAVASTGADGRTRVVTHSLCDVRNDDEAPCTLPSGSPSVDATLAALGVRPSGGRHMSSAAAALRDFRDGYILRGSVLPRRAAAECSPVAIVLVGDLALKPAEVAELRAEAALIRDAIPTAYFVLVPTTPLDEATRRALEEALGSGTRTAPPADFLRDPFGAVVPPDVGTDVGCVARAWSGDGTDLVALASGVAAGRLGLRPWALPPDGADLTAGAVWHQTSPGWESRPVWFSYFVGGQHRTVRVDDPQDEEAVAAEAAGFVGLPPDVVRTLLQFHRGNPAQEVDAGGAWRDRCAPWTGDCRTATERLGPVESPEQVVRAWRPTSGYSDFRLLVAPSMAERAAWPPDSDGAVVVAHVGGVTAFRVYRQPGRAPEELWHHVPATFLQATAVSALPTAARPRPPQASGFQLGDRRLLAVFRAGTLVVYDVTGRPLATEPRPVSFSISGTWAYPLFVPRSGPGGLELHAVTGSPDPAPGRACLVRFRVDAEDPGSSVRTCVDVGDPEPLSAYTSGGNGYDTWWVFGNRPPSPLEPARTYLVAYRADEARIVAWWPIRYRQTFVDPVDQQTRTVDVQVVPLRLVVTPDRVVLLGSWGSRYAAPHGSVIVLWRPMLSARYPSGTPIVLRPDAPDVWLAAASFEETPSPLYVGRFVSTNRPWKQFCLEGGRLAMCTAWVLELRDVATTGVSRPLGSVVVPLFALGWRSRDCRAPGRAGTAFVPWLWLDAPAPLPQDDPGSAVTLGMRMFYPSPDWQVDPVGYWALQTGRASAVVLPSPWTTQAPKDWGVALGSQVLWTGVMWPHGRLLPNPFRLYGR